MTPDESTPMTNPEQDQVPSHTPRIDGEGWKPDREAIARIVDPEAWSWRPLPRDPGEGPASKRAFDEQDRRDTAAMDARKDLARSKADQILALEDDSPSRSEGSEASLQDRVRPWMLACFGPVIPFDKEERGDRLLEEVFELLQSGGYDPARVVALRDYVWGRDVGEPFQEAGGVMITMAAYCNAFDLDMAQAGETELARIWTKVEAIRAKQAAKPTGSALPISDLPSVQQHEC